MKQVDIIVQQHARHYIQDIRRSSQDLKIGTGIPSYKGEEIRPPTLHVNHKQPLSAPLKQFVQLQPPPPPSPLACGGVNGSRRGKEGGRLLGKAVRGKSDIWDALHVTCVGYGRRRDRNWICSSMCTCHTT